MSSNLLPSHQTDASGLATSTAAPDFVRISETFAVFASNPAVCKIKPKISALRCFLDFHEARLLAGEKPKTKPGPQPPSNNTRAPATRELAASHLLSRAAVRPERPTIHAAADAETTNLALAFG